MSYGALTITLTLKKKACKDTKRNLQGNIFDDNQCKINQ